MIAGAGNTMRMIGISRMWGEMPKKYQLVHWFPCWCGFGFVRAMHGIALIYDWFLWLGFWEVRKWHVLKEGDIERHYGEAK